MQPVHQATQESAGDTREKLLDAAEPLFAEHGYAATSMRAIAQSAGVNLGAANYHFGSKMGLFAAVFHRRIQPINEHRLSLLKGLIESDHPLTIRGILDAFYLPVVEAVVAGQAPRIIGRLFGEPESITRPILEAEFSEVAAAFQQALARMLPDLPPDELQWRFHFTVGAMVHLILFQAPLASESTPDKFIQGMDSLINYAAAGLAQVPPGRHDD